MEDIKCKLELRKPALVESAFTKLLKLLVEKKNTGFKFTRQSEEVVFLKDQCLSSCFAVSQGACDTILCVVENNVLSKQDVQTILLSLAVNGK